MAVRDSLRQGTQSGGLVAKCLKDARLDNVEHYEHGWTFRFDNGALLNFQSLWRLFSDKLILVTSEDDGQQFGLPQPVNAVDELMKRVGGKRVTQVDINGATSDLTVCFAGGHLLQVVTTSSGYEAWDVHLGKTIVVGRNGDAVEWS